MGNTNISVTVCTCAFRRIMNKDEIIQLVSALKNAGQTVTVVSDLCKTAISDAEQMAMIASTTVVACYPRAVKSIFDRVGLNPKQVFDIRNHTSEQILQAMGVSNPGLRIANPGFSAFETRNQKPETSQEAWYPVIDKERCTECGKCHDFCLFGVYAVKDKAVKVTQPQNCKNNCPACARVCPSKAIIFPKYEKSPINGGLHNEETFNDEETKTLYNNALKHKLNERRTKVALVK